MIFRVINDQLYEVDIEVSDEQAWVNAQTTENVRYISINEDDLPPNPYPVAAAYKLDPTTNNITLDIDRMLENYKLDLVVTINKQREDLINEGYLWTRPNSTEKYLISLDDLGQKGLMTLALQTLLGITEGLYFISKDNIIIHLTAQEAQDLAIKAGTYVSTIIYQARIYKDKILAATSFDEINTILVEMETALQQIKGSA